MQNPLIALLEHLDARQPKWFTPRASHRHQGSFSEAAGLFLA
jgi:hypothetical protein